MLWKFVPDWRTTHAESAAAKSGRPRTWNDCNDKAVENERKMLRTKTVLVLYALVRVSCEVVDVVDVDACPPGTYSTGWECVDCPTDSYQHRDGATSCLPCPRGTYTSRRAARNVTECTGKCAAGE